MVFNIERSDLDELYATNTAKQIAQDNGVSVSTVRRRLKQYGIRKPYARSGIEAETITEVQPETEDDLLTLTYDYELQMKNEMLEQFKSWGYSNLRGGVLATEVLADMLDGNMLSYEDDGTAQVNTEDYTDANSKGIPVVKLRWDVKQKRLNVIMRGVRY